MNSFGYYPYSFGGYNSYPMNYGMPMMSYAPATTDNKAAPATPYTMPMTTMPSTTMPYYSNYGIPASYGTPMYYKNGMEYKFESQRGMTFPIAPTVPYAPMVYKEVVIPGSFGQPDRRQLVTEAAPGQAVGAIDNTIPRTVQVPIGSGAYSRPMPAQPVIPTNYYPNNYYASATTTPYPMIGTVQTPITYPTATMPISHMGMPISHMGTITTPIVTHTPMMVTGVPLGTVQQAL